MTADIGVPVRMASGAACYVVEADSVYFLEKIGDRPNWWARVPMACRAKSATASRVHKPSFRLRKAPCRRSHRLFVEASWNDRSATVYDGLGQH
jgi:hypothetical protein